MDEKEVYGLREYRKILEGDRMYADRLLIVDYRLIKTIKQEAKHIAFLGPLIDKTEDLNVYRTIIVIKKSDDKEKAEKRIYDLCFNAEVMTPDEINKMRQWTTNSGIICTKLRYEYLRSRLIGDFYVLQ